MNTEEQTNTVAATEIAPNDNLAESAREVEVGMAHFHADRLNDAMLAFQRALAINPNSARAHNGMGRVYYHTGPPQHAIDAYGRAIALDRHYIDAYYGLGILYSAQLGDYEAALAAFQAGLAHNPNDAFLMSSLGSTYARMGRFDEAIAMLHQALALQPDQTFAYSWLSIIALHQQRYDDVIAICLREIEIEDTDEPRRKLGYVYTELGRYDEAITQLEKAVEFAPEDYEARAALAKVYRTVGRQHDADTHYAHAREQAMQDNEYGQACFAAVSGNVEEALTLLEIGLTKGQVQKGWIRIDPEFAFILNEPRFQAMIVDKR